MRAFEGNTLVRRRVQLN